MKAITEVTDDIVVTLRESYLSSLSQVREDVKVPSRIKPTKPFVQLAEFLCGTQIDPDMYVRFCGVHKISERSFTTPKTLRRYGRAFDKLTRRTGDLEADLTASAILLRKYTNDYDLDETTYFDHHIGKIPAPLFHLDVGILHPKLMIAMKGYRKWRSKLPPDYLREVDAFIESVRAQE